MGTIALELGVATVGAVALVIGSYLAYRSSSATSKQSRMARMEARQDILEYRNRRLWTYARQLIDHIYRGDPPPPPSWPDDLDDDPTT